MLQEITDLIDLEAFPEIAELIYVSNSEAGISRVRKGKKFHYFYKNKRLTSEKHLQRIKSLVIPPAWEKVWICKDANGHMQCTGIDARGRKQYRYHPLWNKARNESKYAKLTSFGKTLIKLRKQIRSDLNKKKLSEEKVIATVLALMDATHIRIGNNQYEKMNRSYGLTTLKDHDVDISGDHIHFVFSGKKSVKHKISLKNKRLARIVKQCREIPGKELFQYFDKEGNRHPIDSGKVNTYLRKYTDDSFSTKDLRTWSGTVYALQGFLNVGAADNQILRKKNILEVLDMVSKQLGNTQAVCKKYYVHPAIIQLYESGELEQLTSTPIKKDLWLNPEEKLLLRILKKYTARTNSKDKNL